MDLEIVILSEVSQRKKNILIWYHLYVQSKKRIQMNLPTNQKHSCSCRKQIYDYKGVRLRGGENWEIGIDRLLCPWNSPGRNTGVGSCSLLQRYLPNPGIKPRYHALQVDSLLAELPGKPIHIFIYKLITHKDPLYVQATLLNAL